MGRSHQIEGFLVRCISCTAVNDQDFNYCKACGVERKSIIQGQNQCSSQKAHVTLEDKVLAAINSRIACLDNLLDSSKYSKQKCNLKSELITFLEHLQPPKNLTNALPDELRQFLVFKEKNGRTHLHSQSCLFRGSYGQQKCGCPTTLAAKSVDSLIGKIRAIFRDIGRSGDWNPMLLSGNPASSYLLKRHLQSIELEQQAAEVTRKQAVPLFFDKLAKLCRHLSYRISVEKDGTSRFLLARDRAYFSMLSHSGDRGSDLGLLTSSRIFQLPNSDVLISQTAGKTASLDNPNNFILKLSKDTDICPVLLLKAYMCIAEQAGVDLRSGFLFRIKDRKSKIIVDKPVNSTIMSDRLKLHLSAVNLYEGETSHSSRRGCAITLRLLGLDDGKINKHIGWNSQGMIDHYASVGKICGPRGVAATLSNAASTSSGSEPKLYAVSQNVKSMKNLKRFHFH